MRKEDSEQDVGKTISVFARKSPHNVGGMAPWACQRIVIRAVRPTRQDLRRPLAIGRKEMQADFEGIQAGTRVEVCHIFFRKEAGNPIGVELGFGNIRLNSVIVYAEYYNGVRFHKSCPVT